MAGTGGRQGQAGVEDTAKDPRGRPVGGTAGGHAPPGNIGQPPPLRNKERAAFQPVVALAADLGRTV